MNAPIPSHKKKGSPWSAWILRLAIGVALIGMSLWGIALCREIFRAYVGPSSVPGDSSFASLGAWAAWALFFAPLAVGGIALVWSTLRKMDALDQFASWLGSSTGQPDASLANIMQFGGVVRGGKPDDPRGLETLSPETVERLQRSAARAATILGALTGASLLGIGIFGLVSLLLLSGPSASSSIYAPLATVRATVSFAVFSGMLVLLGIVILQQTFRRDNNSWLLPLRVFTYMIIMRAKAGERTGLAGQHRPTTKQHPRV